MSLNSRINSKLLKCALHENMPFPTKNLLIEVTNCCNNKCIFCYNHCMKRKKQFINEKLCKIILDQAFELGCREVGFYATGEPLLNPKLSEYICHAKKIGYEYIYITTNGILADLNKVKELFKSGLDSIKYSINATNSEDYKYIHGTDNFFNVLHNLKTVYDWKIENDLSLNVFVSYIATRHTYDKIQIDNLFKNKCDEYVVMNVENQGGLIPDIKDFLSHESIKTQINNNFSLPCTYPFNSIILTVEGYLTACCMDFENFLAYADLNKCTLEEAWNNQTITRFREAHLNGNVDDTICNNCINNCRNIPKPLNKKLCKLRSYDVFCNHLTKHKE